MGVTSLMSVAFLGGPQHLILLSQISKEEDYLVAQLLWGSWGVLVFSRRKPLNSFFHVFFFLSAVNVDQTPYGIQMPGYPKALSYPKPNLLSDICQTSTGPNLLSPEQDFSLFPKTQVDAVSVNYCTVNQDFTRSNLNLLIDNSGELLSVWQ